jgi:hypothetical protein
MGGLLDSAKRTVWSIATHIRELDKDTDLHLGLVAYRDLGDQYVTKDFPLSGDLDAVFAELSGYRAEGGGDPPEDVDAALYDAVHKMQWRDGAKKMIFLVGDAPPASRGDVQRYEISAREAGEQQIIVNTIRCGQAPDTAAAWQQIAELGNGQFSTIEQDGGVRQIATPYDEKIATLSRAIDATAVIYGDDAVHAAYEGKMAAAAAAPLSAKADRAAYYLAKPGVKGAGRASEDVVGGFATGTLDVGSLDPNKLPGDLRGKSAGELGQELARRVAERDAAQKELAELARQRGEYLRAHADGKDGFDARVEATVDAELK